MKKFLIKALTLLLICSLLPIIPVFAENTALQALTVESFTNEIATSITKDLTLPSEIGGEAITWEVTGTGIDANGKVTRKLEEAQSVTLTATTASDSKSFNYTVAPQTMDVIYQDNFAYPDWAGKAFMDASRGNTIGWDDQWGMNLTDQTIALDNGNYVFKKSGNITERTIYTFPSSPDNITVTFDIKFEAPEDKQSIYDFKFGMGAEGQGTSNVAVRYTFNKSTAEVPTEVSYANVRIPIEDEVINKRNSWIPVKATIDQKNQTISLWINNVQVLTDKKYTPSINADDRLTRLFIQPGSQSTCSPLMIDNFIVYEPKSAATFNVEKAVDDTILNLSSDLFSTQSSYAITENLNLSPSALAELNEKNGTTVTFESNNTNILSNSGAVKQSDSETTVVLTATVSKENVSKTKDLEFVVLPQGAYLFESESFSYPEYVGEYLPVLERWSGRTDETNFYAKIAKKNNSYFMEGQRSGVSTTNWYTYDFSGIRKTEKISLEFTITYRENISNYYYDFEFYGQDSSGAADNTNKLGYIRIANSEITASNHNWGTRYGTSRATTNSSDRIRLDFDFVNQCYDAYVNGKKITAYSIKFPNTVTYSTLANMKASNYRESTGSHYEFDDFTVKANAPVYLSDNVYDDVATRPLTAKLSLYRNDPFFAITSSYNDTYNLRQNLALLSYNDPYENQHFDFSGAALVEKATGTEKQLVNIDWQDESAPFLINGDYTGCNHGMPGILVESTGHDKTFADIGTVWKEDSCNDKWVLIRIVDKNGVQKLNFVALPKETSDSITFKKYLNTSTTQLVYSEDDNTGITGNSTTAITITKYDQEFQTKPSISIQEQKMYYVRDGIKTEISYADFEGKPTITCDEIILEERYNILSPESVIADLRANRISGAYTANPLLDELGTPVLNYHQTITVKSDGTILTELDHKLIEDVYSLTYYGSQFHPKDDVFGGGVYRYLPGTTAFTNSSNVSFDFSAPSKIENFQGSFTLNSSNWSNQGYNPDRFINYFKNTDGDNVMAFAAGFLPIGEAEVNSRAEKVTYSTYIPGHSQKTYPIFVNSANGYYKNANDTIKGVTYRKYIDLNNPVNKDGYTIEYDDKAYYYFDNVAAESKFNLSSEYIVTSAEVVYASKEVALSGTTVTISGNEKDFIVAAGTRGIEIEDAVYDKSSKTISFKLLNYGSEEKSVKLVAASYNNGKLCGISNSDVITAQGGVTIDSFAVNTSGDTFKLYIWDGSTDLKPVNLSYDILN